MVKQIMAGVVGASWRATDYDRISIKKFEDAAGPSAGSENGRRALALARLPRPGTVPAE
jgi:hypothetical protein